MNWEAIGAIGEIIGALAVVATLAYLAQQVRTQNRANEMASFDGLMDGFNQFNSMLATDKGLYRLFMTGLNHPEKLDDDEAGRFTALFRMHINSTHKIFEAYKRGAFPEQLWRDFAAQAADMWYSPGGRALSQGHPVHGDYQDALRKNLRESTTIDMSLGREKIQRSDTSDG
jgi:hypothetical protein